MTGMMNVPAFTSGVSGMAEAARRYDSAARKVATAPAEPGTASDFVEATTLAPAAYTANATVVRVADETRTSLIDILA